MFQKSSHDAAALESNTIHGLAKIVHHDIQALRLDKAMEGFPRY